VSILTGDTVVALLFVCTFVTLSDNVGRNELAPEKKQQINLTIKTHAIVLR